MRAWCDMNLGGARLRELTSIPDRTTFRRAIAKALGIGASYMRKATEMQVRVEEVLQRTGLALVIDESHYMFPQAQRIYTRPELIDWTYTALFHQRVPCALISTPQFSAQM